MLKRLALLLLLGFCGPLRAESPAPLLSPEIAALDWGVFCALQSMDRAPAPGTRSGWIHVPNQTITFHWPKLQTVPAMIGIGFGVEAIARTGWQSQEAQARVYRPDRAEPEVWNVEVSDRGANLIFFRFDEEEELVGGTWAFEVWEADLRLYRLEFEVLPASTLPQITEACGATS